MRKAGKKRGSGELERSQKMLICRRIKRESLFQNIDFHTAGMKNNIGHRLRRVSTGRLWTVTKEIASYMDLRLRRRMIRARLSCSLVANKWM